MACYFETAAIEGSVRVHGGPQPGFLRLIREKQMKRITLPVEKVVRAGPEESSLAHASDAGRRTDDDAHSWALARFLALRVTREQIEAYVDEVLSSKDPVASFERLAGRSCARLVLDLKTLSTG